MYRVFAPVSASHLRRSFATNSGHYPSVNLLDEIFIASGRGDLIAEALRTLAQKVHAQRSRPDL